MGISHTTDLIAASPRQRCCKDGSSHSQPAERPWEHLHCSHSPKQSPCKIQNSRLWRATWLLERHREGNHPRSGSCINRRRQDHPSRLYYEDCISLKTLLTLFTLLVQPY